MEEQVRREELYRGRIFAMWRDEVRLADGTMTTREVIQHPGAVVLIPVLGSQVVLVSQFRYATGEMLLELPAGTLEPNEPPEQAAHRELREETGYTAGRLQPIGRFFSAPGFTSELLHVFLADQLQPGLAHPDDDERLSVVLLDRAEAIARARSGGFRDMKTEMGLLWLALAEGGEPNPEPQVQPRQV